jgi:hypothetical protein
MLGQFSENDDDRMLSILQFAYCYLDDLRIARPDLALATPLPGFLEAAAI